MEKDPNYIVAIDMGTSKVVTIVASRAGDGKISVIASSCAPATGITRGDIKNIDQIVRSVQCSIDAINAEWGIKVCEAYVGLSGQHIKCGDHDGYVFIVNPEGEVHADDVNKLCTSMENIQLPPGEVIIHILPKSYTLDEDTDINDPVGMIGNKLTGLFKIVTGIKRNMDLVDRSLKRVDVGIVSIVLSSLASAEAVLVDDEKELGVAVVDIGGGSCDVCIYHDKTIRYLGVIPFGGNNINKDIKSYGVLERHVEKLKVKFGSALQSSIPETQVIELPGINNSVPKEIPQRVLASIIEARMLDVIERLQEMISESGFTRLPGGIVLTGGGAMLKDVDKLFAQNLNCDVRIGRPTVYVTDDTADKISDPKYSTAVGLILKGISIGEPTKTIVTQKPRALDTIPADYYTQGQGGGYAQRRAAESIEIAKPKKSIFDGADVVDKGVDANPTVEEQSKEAKRKGGFGSWFKNKTDKLRDMFDADEEIENNNTY